MNIKKDTDGELPYPSLGPTNKAKKELLEIIAYLLIDHAKFQMKQEGRLGPNEFDFNTVVKELQTGRIKIMMRPGSPNYPELQFCP